MVQGKYPKKIFVTGTDTGVGKTFISAILVVGLTAEYWKPIQSGIEDKTDTQWVAEKTGLPQEYFHPETYLLKLPISPHASSANEGISIKLEEFKIPKNSMSKHLVIEGAGGIMVPLNKEKFMIDLMKKIGAPILLVTSSSLGTINHTILSLLQLRDHGLDIMGVVMNGEKNAINRRAIEHYGKVEVLAEIEKMKDINQKTLMRLFRDNFNYIKNQ
jgi:dethiobiotin synthase